ncbi:MAG: CDP-alcohol phosphatidyltransferase family protein [Chlamydiales bacterium]|nr:CDP-alcohol phosphatidyltransferase family protein [Chlamydiales bacterium]
MKKVFLVPSVITAFGLACGLFVIFKSIFPVETSVYSMIYTSALILLLAAFADLLDGAIARAFHAESEFGFMFDSLADAISFGVAPSVLFLSSIELKTRGVLSFFVIAGCMIYSICAVLRLVRFNVSSTENRGDQQAELLFKKTFVGFPTPAAAGVAVSMNFFLTSPICEEFFPIDMQTRIIIMICTLILLGYFMISRWKFPTLKTVRVKIRSVYLVFLSALLAMFILFGILHFMSLLFLICSLGYLMLGFVLSVIRKIAGKNSTTLEDFDPDKEDLD